jgi:hypothetical protein
MVQINKESSEKTGVYYSPKSYAGFWERVFAWIIDLIVVSILIVFYAFIFYNFS